MTVTMRMRWTIVTTAAGLGFEGLGSAFVGPGADAAIITMAWVGMIMALAVQANVEMDKSTALKIVTAILVAFTAFMGGTKLALQGFAYTGVGTVPALIANCGVNAVVTYLTGVSVANIFVQDRRVGSAESFAGAVVSAVLASLGLGGDDTSAS